MPNSLFDWDNGNIGHIAEHNVTPAEVEEAMSDPRRVVVPAYSPPDEIRQAILGLTTAERLLYTVFTFRRGLIRAITARDANRIERPVYWD